MQVLVRAIALSLFVSLLAGAGMTGCRFHSGDEPVTVSGSYPIFYVKRPVGGDRNPIDSVSFNAGADLISRDLASPAASEVNITNHITLGKGDVSDPSPSFDGTKVVFAMRCSAASSQLCAQDKTWDIWLYDMSKTPPSLEPVIKDFAVRAQGDDTDPIFVPGNKIIFSSTRQQATRDRLGYVYSGEDLRGPASVLHVMDLNGSNVQQLSFSQGHERNPSVMQNGRILFTRLENIGDNNKFALFSMNPDGTDIRSVYGAHSPGDAFMSPAELPDGRIITTVLPLAGTFEGGALMTLDVKQYADNDDPAPGVLPGRNGFQGQKPATVFDIPIDNEISVYGRYATPSPVYDGTNDLLVSYSPFQGIKQVGGTTPVDSPFDLNKENPPQFGIYMFNAVDRSLKPIVLPTSTSSQAYSLTDAVAVAPRREPPLIPPQVSLDPARTKLAANEGIVHIRSVYDTDRYGRLGLGVLTTEERVTMAIPQMAPPDPSRDRREQIADLAKLKNPLSTNAAQRPARFIRVIEGLPSPVGLSVDAIGVTPFEMRRLVGYAPIEPDGSVKVKVPASRPIAIEVLDAFGRAFENPTNWIQVQPGETLTCNGCHAPRLTESINRSPIAGSHPNTALRRVDGAAVTGAAATEETMAETRTRLDPTALELSLDFAYSDVWTNASVRSPDADLRYTYAELTTPTPTNGVIEYPIHIQPLWELSRPSANGDRKCTGCHNGFVNASNNPSGLNLSGTRVAGSGRFISYDELLVGDIVNDSSGLPVFETIGTGLKLQRDIPLVRPGYSRRSYLIEKLFNQELHAERGLPASGIDHSSFLTAAEKRLIVEWIDVGGQYFNSPTDAAGNLRTVAVVLDKIRFNNALSMFYEGDKCSSCHRPLLFAGRTNKEYVPTRFVLTGNFESDFAIAASMVTDLDTPANSALISIPMSTTAHPVRSDNKKAYIEQDDELYKRLMLWLEDAKQKNQPLVLSVPYSRVVSP